MKKTRRRGQGLIEYALVILIAVGLFGALAISIKDPIISLFGCVDASLGCNNGGSPTPPIATPTPTPTPTPAGLPGGDFHPDSDTSVFTYAGHTTPGSNYNSECTLLWGSGTEGSVTFTVQGHSFSVVNSAPGGWGGTMTVEVNSQVVAAAQDGGTVTYASNPGDVVLVQGHQDYYVACFGGSTF
jgi:hypothetical protein